MELQTKQLILAVKQIAEEKNLSEDAVHSVIEQALAAAYRKDYGDRDQEVRTVVNTTSGDFKVFVSKDVVEKVENEHLQITLADAKKIDPKAEIEGTVEISDSPTHFGRVAAQTAKQVILQRLREAEREIILEEYEDKIGTVVNGTVNRVDPKVVRIDLGKAQGILPRSEQIQGEFYSVGARIRVYLKDVERTNRGPQLILSRGNKQFVEHLFRNEVPEMDNGAVAIERIAREAGVRTKIAVSASVPGVDPVGTFVGGHGTRVQAVMGEIGDREKIDIITFDKDMKKLIENSMSPTDVEEVILHEESKKATVKVREDQLSVAIGKNGQNVRLASMLTGYDIDIESTTEEAPKAEPEKVQESSEEVTKDDQEVPAKNESAEEPKTKEKDVPVNESKETPVEKVSTPSPKEAPKSKAPKKEKGFKSKEKLESSLLDTIAKNQ